AARRPHAHFLTGGDRVRRDIDLLPVDLHGAVPDELTGHAAAGGEAHATENVVETHFERRDQVRALHARLRGNVFKDVAELALGEPVDALHLLLLTELLRVLGRLAAALRALAVLARRVRTAL